VELGEFSWFLIHIIQTKARNLERSKTV